MYVLNQRNKKGSLYWQRMIQTNANCVFSQIITDYQWVSENDIENFSGYDITDSITFLSICFLNKLRKIHFKSVWINLICSSEFLIFEEDHWCFFLASIEGYGNCMNKRVNLLIIVRVVHLARDVIGAGKITRERGNISSCGRNPGINNYQEGATTDE